MNAIVQISDPLLTAREEIFARWYGQLGDIADAYLNAFPEEGRDASRAMERGRYMLRKASVRRRAIEWRGMQAATMADDVRALAAFYRAGMTAERNLIQYMRVNCRYCHGQGGGYQWVLADYLAALAKAEHYNRTRPARAAEQMLPDPSGGFGFDAWGDPNPHCDRCRGRGEGVTYVADGREMPPDEAIAFEGWQLTKDGVKASYISKADSAAGLMKLRGIGAENVNLHLTTPDEREEVTLKAEIVPRDPQKAADFYREFLLQGAKRE